MAKYNLSHLSRNFFPWFWQTDANMALVDLLQSVFDQPNEDYEDYETLCREKVGYSIQRLSLQNGLNDMYDSRLRRIQVINGEGFSICAFNEDESVPDWTGEMFVRSEAETTSEDTYIYNSEESLDAVTPFIVLAPISLQGPYEQSIRSAIEYVLISGTEYNLTFI